jgi:ATP-dependent DNA helicase DinG
MSATILSDTWMAEDIGLERTYELVKVPSTFPVENRHIHVVDVADMAFKLREESWPEMVKGVAAVLNRHPDDRILVHTVSYNLARYLKDGLKDWGERHGKFARRPILIYNSSEEKDDVLRRYKRTPGCVLLAASMDRGVDLPDDMCRVQVVAKIPHGNIKDKRVNARMRSPGGSIWYRMQAIRSLVQMTGRGVRSAEDHAVTYILDSQFTDNLWRNGKYLFPDWWKEALSFRMQKRHLIGDNR